MLCVAKVLSGPCLSWVKLRRTQCGHMFSALLSNSDIAQCGWHVSNVPMNEPASAGCRVNSITSDVRSGFGHTTVFMEFLYFGCLIHIVFICDLPALLGLERAASEWDF